MILKAVIISKHLQTNGNGQAPREKHEMFSIHFIPSKNKFGYLSNWWISHWRVVNTHNSMGAWPFWSLAIIMQKTDPTPAVSSQSLC